jgi:hypothetical protein
VLERAIAKVVQLKEIPHKYFAVSAAGGQGPPPVCGERDQEHSGMTGRLKRHDRTTRGPGVGFLSMVSIDHGE